MALSLDVNNLTQHPTTGGWPVNFTAGYLIDHDGLASGCTEYPYSFLGLFQPDMKIALETNETGHHQLQVANWTGSWNPITYTDVEYTLQENITMDPSISADPVDTINKTDGQPDGLITMGLQQELPVNQSKIMFNFSLIDFPDLNTSIFSGNEIKITPITTFHENSSQNGFAFDLINSTPGTPEIEPDFHVIQDPLSKTMDWINPVTNIDSFAGKSGSSVELTGQYFSANAQYNITIFYMQDGVLCNVTLTSSGMTNPQGEINEIIIIPTLSAGFYLIKTIDEFNKVDYVGYEIQSTTTTPPPPPIPGFEIPLVFMAMATLIFGIYWRRKKQIK